MVWVMAGDGFAVLFRRFGLRDVLHFDTYTEGSIAIILIGLHDIFDRQHLVESRAQVGEIP